MRCAAPLVASRAGGLLLAPRPLRDHRRHHTTQPLHTDTSLRTSHLVARRAGRLFLPPCPLCGLSRPPRPQLVRCRRLVRGLLLRRAQPRRLALPLRSGCRLGLGCRGVTQRLLQGAWNSKICSETLLEPWSVHCRRTSHIHRRRRNHCVSKQHHSQLLNHCWSMGIKAGLAVEKGTARCACQMERAHKRKRDAPGGCTRRYGRRRRARAAPPHAFEPLAPRSPPPPALAACHQATCLCALDRGCRLSAADMSCIRSCDAGDKSCIPIRCPAADLAVSNKML